MWNLYNTLMAKPNTEFGKHCRMLRVEKGLTMQTANERIGRSQPQISQAENETTEISLDYIMACLKGYDLQDVERVDFLAKALARTPQIALP
ncbi:hypothetical protein FACS1894130_11090 [Spirochaetia bacterium]|nr:hypothetical protein FACS1894130_11090 [Spirochaetia bacterium]